MKISLDECITKRLKPHLTEYEVMTVTEMKWNGIKNGELLELCVINNLDLLLTIDKNLMFQQKVDKFRLTTVVLNSATSKIEELLLFLPSFKDQVKKFEKYKNASKQLQLRRNFLRRLCVA